MSRNYVVITKSDGTEHGKWPIDNDQIERAAELEAELHNRDNQYDIWVVEIRELKK
jgi:hypothetical protein